MHLMCPGAIIFHFIAVHRKNPFEDNVFVDILWICKISLYFPDWNIHLGIFMYVLNSIERYCSVAY